jgi:hypothetical protein
MEGKGFLLIYSLPAGKRFSAAPASIFSDRNLKELADRPGSSPDQLASDRGQPRKNLANKGFATAFEASRPPHYLQWCFA